MRIFGVERDVRAEVVVLNGFTAHADKNDLRAPRAARKGARHLFLVHGEPEQQAPLAAQLTQDGLPVSIPKVGDVVPMELRACGSWGRSDSRPRRRRS